MPLELTNRPCWACAPSGGGSSSDLFQPQPSTVELPSETLAAPRTHYRRSAQITTHGEASVRSQRGQLMTQALVASGPQDKNVQLQLRRSPRQVRGTLPLYLLTLNLFVALGGAATGVCPNPYLRHDRHRSL